MTLQSRVRTSRREADVCPLRVIGWGGGPVPVAAGSSGEPRPSAAPRPFAEVATEDEVRALRFAVIFAWREGIATDDLDSRHPSNRSLVSVAEKLGIDGVR